MNTEATPRTEAALVRTHEGVIMDLRPFGQIVPAEFARTLERELREVHAARFYTMLEKCVKAFEIVEDCQACGCPNCDNRSNATVLDILTVARAELERTKTA